MINAKCQSSESLLRNSLTRPIKAETGLTGFFRIYNNCGLRFREVLINAIKGGCDEA
jgi:hypothetical protein